MKALVYAGPKHVEVQEVKEPEKQDGKVKLNIRYCGVCGSDIGIYLGTHPRAKAPLILGHEFLGIVAEDGNVYPTWIDERSVWCGGAARVLYDLHHRAS